MPAIDIILDDPEALAVLTAVSKHNCWTTLHQNAERIAHFQKRASDLGKSDSCALLILNVDDLIGGELAAILMPGHDWQAYRDQGQVPFARGLADREGMQGILELVDPEEALKLRSMTNTLPVIVMDHQVVVVFRADECAEESYPTP
jgi:hypothetical protein